MRRSSPSVTFVSTPTPRALPHDLTWCPGAARCLFRHPPAHHTHTRARTHCSGNIVEVQIPKDFKESASMSHATFQATSIPPQTPLDTRNETGLVVPTALLYNITPPLHPCDPRHAGTK